MGGGGSTGTSFHVGIASRAEGRQADAERRLFPMSLKVILSGRLSAIVRLVWHEKFTGAFIAGEGAPEWGKGRRGSMMLLNEKI